MQRLVDTKFFHIYQNNSGGYLIEDDEAGIGGNLIIEARDAEDALSRLNKLGNSYPGFWSYCSCCGPRWDDYIDEDDGKEIPTMYGVSVEETKKDYLHENVFIHYYDGKIEKVEFKDE